MLPDQMREGAGKACRALSNDRRVNVVVIWKEIIIKISIYLSPSTEPRQFCANKNPTQPRGFCHQHTVMAQQIFTVCGLTSPGDFKSAWSTRENSAREGTGAAGEGQVLMKVLPRALLAHLPPPSA